MRASGVCTAVGRLRIGLIVCAGAATGALVIAMRWPSTGSSARLGCDGFDFPVGAPDGVGYYDAQPFGDNDHLGNDWNGNSGGDTDLGDPVYAVAAGTVFTAHDHAGGWGNVVRITHACGPAVESLYAHLDTIEVPVGVTVRRGQRIGTIGNAGGQYLAHLHFELRSRFLPLGGGYDTDRSGYLDPTSFIERHRPFPPSLAR